MVARRPAIWISITIVVILGAFLRFEAALGDLWLDEIYSLMLLQPLTSAWQVFSVGIDNNHYLNSLYLFCIGSEASPLTYRTPALIFGVLTIMLATYVCLQEGVLEGLLGALAFSFSYILILYSSEARGYSSLLFFSLLCFVIARRYRCEPSIPAALSFWLSAFLALLSHFTFLHFYAALLLWTIVEWKRSGKSSVLRLLQLHTIPLLACAALFATRFLNLTIAGGPQGSRLDVLINSLSVPFGGGELSISNLEAGVLLLGLAVFAVVVLTAEIVQQIKAKQEDAWFFFILVLVAPVILLVVFRPEVFVVRYILLSIFFAYFVFVKFLARLLRRDFAGRVIAGVILGLYILGNANMLDKLYRHGRGQYAQALDFIAAHSEQETITIGSDQDFRNGVLVGYFGARVRHGKTFRYIDHQFPAPSEADWVITHSQDPYEIPPAELPESKLTLAATFDSAALSGLRWFVYCREGHCPVIVGLR